jgi:hypothetical protein
MNDSPATLQLDQIATLDVAAGSGIVLRAQHLYVIADDQNTLAVYTLDGRPSASIPLLDEVLPETHRERKAQKPDFESLLSLPDGSLLALGSGSTPRRMVGAWLRFDHEAVSVERIALQELYAALARELPELNIEGGCVLGEQLYLACRGNGADPNNALIALDLHGAQRSLERDRALGAELIRKLNRVSLGALSGTALSLTDLAPLGEQLVFSAAAEASPNTYDDGLCAGSVLGSLSLDGRVGAVHLLSPRTKIEGICATSPHDRSLFAVADADDPASRSPLFKVALP